MSDTSKPTIDLSKIGVMASPPAVAKPPTQSKGYGSKKPSEFTFYKVSTVGDPTSKNRKITKFNSNLDVESSYNMNYIPSNNGGYYDCQCPASKFDCRHKKILADIENANQLDSEKFFCFELRTFKLATEIA